MSGLTGILLKAQLAKLQEDLAVAREDLAVARAPKKRGRPKKVATAAATSTSASEPSSSSSSSTSSSSFPILLSSLEAHPVATSTSSSTTQIFQFVLPKLDKTAVVAVGPIPLSAASAPKAIENVVERIRLAAASAVATQSVPMDESSSDDALLMLAAAAVPSIPDPLESTAVADPLAAAIILTRSPAKVAPVLKKAQRNKKQKTTESVAVEPPRAQHSVQEKFDAIAALEAGTTSSQVQQQYSINAQTLRNWMRKDRKAAIKAAHAAMTESARKNRIRSSVRSSLAPILRDLFAGYLSVRARTGFLTEYAARQSCLALQTVLLGMLKSLDTSNELIAKFITEITSHHFSREFCKKLLYEQRVVLMRLHGEAGSVNKEVLAAGRAKLKELLSTFEARDIYNCDEAALFWEQISGKLYVPEDTTRGKKQSKKRVTVLCCCNADGSIMQPLLVIHTAVQPRCLKGYKLPVEWRANESAWMTSTLFREWVKKFNLEVGQRMIAEGRDGKLAALLMDNVSTHLTVLSMPANDRCNLVPMFLPPNTTSELQPMDAGIIAAWKAHVRQQIALIQLQLSTSATAYSIPSSFEPMARLEPLNPSRPSKRGTTVSSKGAAQSAPASGTDALPTVAVSERYDLNHAVPIMSNQWRLLSKTTVQNCFKHTGLMSASQAEQMAVYNESSGIDSTIVEERVVETAEERIEQEWAEQQGLLQEFAQLLDNTLPVDDGQVV